MASYAASGIAVLRTIRIPGALPYFFTGLRIASSLAVIAAVVSRVLRRSAGRARARDHLGGRGNRLSARLGFVLGAVLLGLIFYVAPLLLERIAWAAARRPCCESPSVKVGTHPQEEPMNRLQRRIARRGATGSRSSRWPHAAAAAAVRRRAAERREQRRCGTSDQHQFEAERMVTLQLQWVTQAQFAGYIAAVTRASTRSRASTSRSSQAGTDTVPQTTVADGGQADYAIAWVPKALQSREKGANITDVGQVFQRSGTLQISFKDKNITTPADLKGKNVGDWGFGNEYELFAGMTKAGLDPGKDVKIVQQQFDMNALPRRRHRRRAGDDLQRVRPGARGQEPRRPASSTSPPTST